MYLASTNIQLYPSAYRGVNGSNVTYNPESILNTEFNLTTMINRLTSQKSFVMTPNFDSGTGLLEFSIHGYYFKIKLTISDFSSYTSIYANIRLKQLSPDAADIGGNNTGYKALSLVKFEGNITTAEILDADTEFKALNLSNTAAASQTGYEIYSLLLLTKTDNTWSIPASSKIKFTLDNIDSGNTLTTTPASVLLCIPTIKTSTLLPATSSSNIGADDDPFINIYTSNLSVSTLATIEEASITDLTVDVLLPKSATSSIGDVDYKIPTIYATTIYSSNIGSSTDKVDTIYGNNLGTSAYPVTNAYINNIYGTNLGSSASPFSEGFFTTIYGSLSGTALNASYAAKIGTNATHHPQIGSSSEPIYINSNGTPTYITTMVTTDTGTSSSPQEISGAKKFTTEVTTFIGDLRLGETANANKKIIFGDMNNTTPYVEIGEISDDVLQIYASKGISLASRAATVSVGSADDVITSNGTRTAASWKIPLGNVRYLTEPPTAANNRGLQIVVLSSSTNPIASTTQYGGYIYMWY